MFFGNDNGYGRFFRLQHFKPFEICISFLVIQWSKWEEEKGKLETFFSYDWWQNWKNTEKKWFFYWSLKKCYDEVDLKWNLMVFSYFPFSSAFFFLILTSFFLLIPLFSVVPFLFFLVTWIELAEQFTYLIQIIYTYY